jgi:transporter family protein
MASSWIFYALLAAVFAGLVAIFGKIGLKNVDVNLATTIRAFVMFMFLIIVILFQKKFSLISQFHFIDYLFIVLAGIAGALSWLFYFLALRAGDATKVASLDRLSVVFVMVFALLFLGEKFSLKVLGGVVLIVIGAILMVI